MSDVAGLVGSKAVGFSVSDYVVRSVLMPEVVGACTGRGPFWSAPTKIRNDSTDGGYNVFEDIDAVIRLRWAGCTLRGRGERMTMINQGIALRQLLYVLASRG
jgi:hypothetical protein